MSIRQFGTIFLFCIALFAIAIEISFPAPKISQYCSQPNCIEAARDILIGKNEDYLGQRMPTLLFGFGLGLIMTIFSLLTKNPKRWGMFGLTTMLAAIVYGIFLRFYVVFSLWPTGSWSVTLLLLSVCSVLLLAPSIKRRS